MLLPLLLALAADPSASVLQAPAEMKWVDSPVLPGARQAVLWGDPGTGAYGLLRRLPAGAALPWHTHSQDSRAVVVSGTLRVGADDAPARELGPGSHVFMPAGRRHRVACTAAAECLYLEQQPGAADFKRADPPAAGRE